MFLFNGTCYVVPRFYYFTLFPCITRSVLRAGVTLPLYLGNNLYIDFHTLGPPHIFAELTCILERPQKPSGKRNVW